jgi:hypothetical protein
LQSTTTETRPRDGQISKAIEPNNLRTVTTYDVFGRPTQVERLGWNGSSEIVIEPPTTISLTDCDFAGGTGCMGGYGEGVGEEHAAYRQTTVKAGSPTQVTWFDNLGRTVVSVRPPHLHLSSNSCCDARPLVWMESGDVEQAFAVGEADRGVAGEW